MSREKHVGDDLEYKSQNPHRVLRHASARQVQAKAACRHVRPRSVQGKPDGPPGRRLHIQAPHNRLQRVRQVSRRRPQPPVPREFRREVRRAGRLRDKLRRRGEGRARIFRQMVRRPVQAGARQGRRHGREHARAFRQDRHRQKPVREVQAAAPREKRVLHGRADQGAGPRENTRGLREGRRERTVLERADNEHWRLDKTPAQRRVLLQLQVHHARYIVDRPRAEALQGERRGQSRRLRV